MSSILPTFMERISALASRRCGRPLQQATAPHPKARWICFILLLGLFLFRIIAMYAFFIVAYAVGIYIVGQVTLFCSPLNDPQSITSSFPLPKTPNEDVEEAVKVQVDDDAQKSRRRMPEYNLWFYCCRSTLVGLVMTFFPFLNVAVFWPALLGYFFCLSVTVLVQVALQRRATNTTMSQATSSSGSKSENDIHIHLVAQGGSFRQFAIVKILPWNATRNVPSRLLTDDKNTTSLEEWKIFLQDLETAVGVDSTDWNHGIEVFGKVLALLYASQVVFHYLYYECQYIQCWANKGCNRLLWVGILAFSPVTAVLVVGCWQHVLRCRSEAQRGFEKAHRICQDFSKQHPHVVCECKLVYVMVRIHIKPSTTGLGRKDLAEETIPNPNNAATEPLLI